MKLGPATYERLRHAIRQTVGEVAAEQHHAKIAWGTVTTAPDPPPSSNSRLFIGPEATGHASGGVPVSLIQVAGSHPPIEVFFPVAADVLILGNVHWDTGIFGPRAFSVTIAPSWDPSATVEVIADDDGTVGTGSFTTAFAAVPPGPDLGPGDWWMDLVAVVPDGAGVDFVAHLQAVVFPL